MPRTINVDLAASVTEFGVHEEAVVVSDSTYTLLQLDGFIANNLKEIEENNAKVVALGTRNDVLTAENVTLSALRAEAVGLGVLERAPVVVAEEPLEEPLNP